MEDKERVLKLEKAKRGLHKAVFGRFALIVVLLAAQVLVWVLAFVFLGSRYPWFQAAMIILSVLVALSMLNTSQNPTVKITWLALIAVMPVFGGALYLYVRTDVGHRTLAHRMEELIEETREELPTQDTVMEELKETSPETRQLAAYLDRSGRFPVYKNTNVTYFPTGEAKFQALLVELEQAKHFIFLEYFIIAEGYMWGRVLDILARKVKEGVEVRLLYDGSNELANLPHRYPKEVEALGIQCHIFAPFRPFVSTHYNYRDHRKILVIDGHTAFTGGINLADEYINLKEKYGHWKDCAIMVKGDAVPSFTMMFLQMWNVGEQEPVYQPYLSAPTCSPTAARGYVLPYGDCPLDDYRAGEMVYFQILNRAERYVHIMTPYLILDGEMETALSFAAQRGVEVKLILPGIPDKTYAYALAKTHYAALLRAGVEIYEYTPGFIHSKMFVSDDCKGVVGTINLDYRSLYHHFECAAYLYDVPALKDMERDFQETLKLCHKITMEDVKNVKFPMKVAGFCLKVVAPLL